MRGCGSPSRDRASFPMGHLVVIPGPSRVGASSPWALVLPHMAQHMICKAPCGNTGNRYPHRSKLQWDHGPRHGHQQQLGPGNVGLSDQNGASSSLVLGLQHGPKRQPKPQAVTRSSMVMAFNTDPRCGRTPDSYIVPGHSFGPDVNMTPDGS